jgi:DNA-directed RNA polymerase sigma subunit (sigma70/sigma32)
VTRKRSHLIAGGDDLINEFDGRDPQIPSRLFTALDEDIVGQADANADVDVDVETVAGRDRQDKLLTVLRAIWDPGALGLLSSQEREVLTRRLLTAGDRATYAAIARATNPPLSGPGQVLKVERRAVNKLRQRLSNNPKDLE